MPQLPAEAQLALAELSTNPRLAHDFFFEHRHDEDTPDFHYEIIDDFHSDTMNALFEAFRGAAKSTIAEEGITIETCFGWFKNGIILSASRDQAIDRLRVVKHELENNEKIIAFFGYLGGTSADTWNEDEIILNNGTRIQALGRGQSFRGVKHLEARPDRLWFDDLEDDESARDEASCDYWTRWFFKVAMAAVDNKKARVRGLATPLHPKSLVMQLRNMPTWLTRRYPIKYISPETNDWVATWPSKYPMEWIDTKEDEMRRMGAAQEFAQEYMCEPEDPATKLFTPEMYKVRPTVRTWEATYAAYDPARTVTKRASTTGKAVFSWVGNRLVVWDGGGFRWKPDEMVNDIFSTNDEFHPIEIGIEEQGLHEFVMQPLRHAQTTRHELLALRVLKPPKGKISFIQTLQPFFNAGEIEFAKDLPEARAQLLSFPSGQIDFPNVLAYALLMRPGMPIYPDFNPTEHVRERLGVLKNKPVYLVVGATNKWTTAVAVQVTDGCLYVLEDWVREGPANDRLSDIVGDASLAVGRHVVLYAGREHFNDYDTIGLRAAANKIPVDVRAGGEVIAGRTELHDLLTRQRFGRSRLVCSTRGRGTLNGFAGGFSRRVDKTGALADQPTDNVYRTLFEALEGFVAVMQYRDASDDRNTLHYDYSADGRKFLTARGGTAPLQPSKDNWHGQE